MVLDDRDSETHDELPRISVGSMRVWLRIKSEFTRAVHAKVDAYAAQNSLPPDRRDAMRRAAHEYAEATFGIAQHNIRINGRDFDSLQPHEQDAEPFDEALDRQIWALASNRLQWHTKIAEERRGTPVVLESTFHTLLHQHETLDAELAAQESDLEEPIEGPEPDIIDADLLGQILAVTGELTQSIPSQRERSERSRAVEAEYKALKP
ncbi:hypothetical protein B0H17DRAFT_985106 [Mycena rosella]|uniref:Uncharacterized protein n=1 Tax=Mycena rosella TaxID=1033263 RepID=A0AAD7D9X7_MYCRO|nr:hypothetical protein B0H17DRAFT_985106 [Mycena rosella]